MEKSWGYCWENAVCFCGTFIDVVFDNNALNNRKRAVRLRPLLKILDPIVMLVLILWNVPLSAAAGDKPRDPAPAAVEKTYSQKMLDRYMNVIDSISTQIIESSTELPMGISSLVIYKMRLKWLLKTDLSVSDQQFLISFFENKLKGSLARSKRVTVFSGHDLHPLYIKADDSTLQVKNVYSEEQLRQYAVRRNIHAVLSPEILITEQQVMVFLILNDLNNVMIWNREYVRSVFDVHIPTEQDKMEELFSLKKKTGYDMNGVTFSFLSGKIRSSGIDVSDKHYSFVATGYRFNDVATIIDPMNVFVDARLLYNPRCSSPGIVCTPGVGFELLQSEKIGSRLITVNIAAGYYFQFDMLQFYPVYHGGMNIRLSRIVGLGLDSFWIEDGIRMGKSYPAGAMFGGHLFFYL